MQIKLASLGLVATVLLSVVDASHLAPKANNGAADVVSPDYTSFARRRLAPGSSKDGNKGLQIGRRSFIRGTQKGDKTVDNIYRRRQVSGEETGEAPEGDKEEGLEEVEEEELKRRSFIYRRGQDVDEAAGEAPEGEKEEELEEVEEEELERRSSITDNKKSGKTVDSIYRRSQYVKGDKGKGLKEKMENTEN